MIRSLKKSTKSILEIIKNSGTKFIVHHDNKNKRNKSEAKPHLHNTRTNTVATKVEGRVYFFFHC